MAIILPLFAKKNDAFSAFGRLSSPAFAAGLSIDYPGRDFTDAEAHELRNKTRHGNDIPVDRLLKGDPVIAQHLKNVKERRAAFHIVP